MTEGARRSCGTAWSRHERLLDPEVRMSRSAWLSIAAVLGLVAMTGDGEVTRFVPGFESAAWPTADGGAGNHYSPLGDITPETVAHLEVAWS
jgi:glucose dehydrogenase